MHDPKPLQGGSHNSDYNLQDGWNSAMWQFTYSYVMPEIYRLEQTAAELMPPFYAIAKILKVLAMQRVTDYYGPVIYTHFGAQGAEYVPDGQQEVYMHFFDDLDEAVEILSDYVAERPTAGEFAKFDLLSRPEKGLQKRVNLMQQKTNSDLSRHYLPRQLRHLILQEYLSGVKTARQLSEEHGIPMSTIHKMGQRWKAKNSCSFVSTPNPYPIMSRVTSEEASELLSENKALRRRLEEALLRLEGYEIMGDILQEEYGIDLLKKSAAGQSSVSKKDTQQ